MKLLLAPGIIVAIMALCQLFSAPGQILAEEDPELTEIQELIHQVHSLIEARKVDTAIILGELALEKAERKFGEFDTTVASALNSLGRCYYHQANHAKCESLHNEALDIREKALGPDHPDVAMSLNNLALLYWDDGKYTQAEPLYKRALAIKENALGPDHSDVAVTLNNLALLYWDQGKYTQAEPLYKRALAIREKALGPDHPHVAQSLNNLALLYSNQGRYAQAEPLYKRALAIGEEAQGPDHPAIATRLSNLGLLCWKEGKYTEAESLYERALAIREKALEPDHPHVAQSLNNLAVLSCDQGKYHQAELLHRRALAIREKVLGPAHPYVASSLYNLAFLYSEQGRYTEAEPLYDRALDIRERSLGSEHPKVAKNLKSLAVLYGSLGEVEKSLTYYKNLQRSRRHFIEYVFSYASEEQKMRYVQEHPLINHSLFSFAIIADSDESRSCALEMILKGKAVVTDAVSAEKQIAFCPYNEEIQKKAERHAQVCGEISTVTLAGAEKLDPEIYRNRLQTLYITKDSLETELSKSCAEFKDELAARRFAVADVASALPLGSVLWEFVRYEPYDFKKIGNDKERTGLPRYLALTLDHAGNITLTDLGDAREIDSLISLARKQIYKARAEVYSVLIGESERRLNEVTARLYDIILAPLESYLGDRTDIFVSPDGQLNLLPFEILPCPDGKYVIEKFRISYLSSGRDLLRFKKKQEPGDWALVLADPDFDLSQKLLAKHKEKASVTSGMPSFRREPYRGVSGCLEIRFDPLPLSREEAESVGTALKKKANLDVDAYYGSHALEEVLKRITAPPRVLHLATHGYFCEDLAENRMLENPLLRSGLAFGGANRLMSENWQDESRTEDGILTAFEASGLNLVGTELITLSACETGVGEVKNCEGVYGLRRAFQHAGAKTIVMSLWKVPDQETRELMDDFYKNWLTGQSKKEALHQSVLKVLNTLRDEYGVAHPLFWGGFVMAGDPN